MKLTETSFRAICKVFSHRRSRRRAFVDPVEHRRRSYCVRCGTPMRKDAVKGWQEG